jgi:hypothetical protein
MFEINITKYFKYYNSEYFEMIKLILVTSLMFIVTDIMKYLNGEG